MCLEPTLGSIDDLIELVSFARLVKDSSSSTLLTEQIKSIGRISVVTMYCSTRILKINYMENIYRSYISNKMNNFYHIVRET